MRPVVCAPFRPISEPPTGFLLAEDMKNCSILISLKVVCVILRSLEVKKQV